MSTKVIPTTVTTTARKHRFQTPVHAGHVWNNDDGLPIGKARNLLLGVYNEHASRLRENLRFVGYNIDDDDLQHPERWKQQVQFLDAQQPDVVKLCFLRRVTLVCHCGFEVVSFTRDGRNSAWDYWENTIMWRGRALHRYPHINQGEDTAMLKAWVQQYGQDSIAVMDAPELYKYRYHGGNVCAADHWDRLFYLSLSGGHFPSACRATPKGDGLGLCSSS